MVHDARKARSLYEMALPPPSNALKRRRTFPSHFSLLQAFLNSSNVKKPPPSRSMAWKARRIDLKLLSAQTLKESTISELSLSMSYKLIQPLRSLSSTRQAPATLPEYSSSAQASSNSNQESLFELSKSRACRQAIKGLSYFPFKSNQISNQASSSGSAASHAVGDQLSNHRKSDFKSMPPPWKSKACSTNHNLSFPSSPWKMGHSRLRKTSAKADHGKLLAVEKACEASQRPSQLPKVSHNQERNRAKSAAPRGARCSSATSPSPAGSKALRSALTSPAKRRRRQKVLMHPPLTTNLPSRSMDLRHARTSLPWSWRSWRTKAARESTSFLCCALAHTSCRCLATRGSRSKCGAVQGRIPRRCFGGRLISRVSW
mmetsp:Transcript_123427/g.308414  ORF Transcript_123427/g.308414 Transcript_123427/m.308414 type:complete len:374 (-) Transcript_123427:142-1263(-)